MKNFKDEFWKLQNLLDTDKPFCFNRFSDGELFILQNKEVRLSQSSYVAGDTAGQGTYTKEEQKHFIPAEHGYQRLALCESLGYCAPNYFKGIPSRTDIPEEEFLFMHGLSSDIEEKHLTFANVFLNSNYPLFMTHTLNKLKNTTRPIAMVLNEACDTKMLPFKITKEFRIGNDCMTNHWDLPKEMADFFEQRRGWIILLSAASLSNLIAHKCFKSNPKNTIIDIGSTLNPLMGLEGWKYSRDYLKHFWMGQKSHYCEREEIW